MSFHTRGIRNTPWRGKGMKPQRRKSKKDPAYEHWKKFAHPKEETGKEVDQRLYASIAAAVIACNKGANIFRVHDVAETVDALKVCTAVLSR